jgi:hypothetical protein
MITSFNGSLSGWNTSKATSMNCMFFMAEKFNQPVNVSNVTDMDGMFGRAYSFNQPLNRLES